MPDGSEIFPVEQEPRPTGIRRFFPRERVLRILRALIAVLLALAAVCTLQGMM